MNLLPENLEIWQATLGWIPNPEQLQLFEQLYLEIIEGNKLLNLTRITEPTEFWEKHLWDSLIGIKPFLLTETPPNFRVIDIGTGAGFPGIPVAISLANIEVTMLDSTRKKITFINSLIEKLSLKNASTYVGRAEEIKKQANFSNQFDLALIRAVGQPSLCAEYAIPLVKKGGLVILYRGQWSNEDTENLQQTGKKLGFKIESVNKVETPLTNSIRHGVYLRKIEEIKTKLLK
jgi:16S rRNA (guanine527-N7)-methyltransferase